MGSKILFRTVFINLEQVVHFLLCRLLTTLNNIVEPESGVTVLFSMLTTAQNNVGSKILFNTVFINLEPVVHSGSFFAV